MKKVSNSIIFVTLSLFLVSTTSCLVVRETSDNGRHRGWDKNTNNPHNPNTTNPGRGHGKNK
jgi:hypothetical protein